MAKSTSRHFENKKRSLCSKFTYHTETTPSHEMKSEHRITCRVKVSWLSEFILYGTSKCYVRCRKTTLCTTDQFLKFVSGTCPNRMVLKFTFHPARCAIVLAGHHTFLYMPINYTDCKRWKTSFVFLFIVYLTTLLIA